MDGTIEEMPPGTDWEVVSRFGSFRSAVITDNEGKLLFDKPRADEAPAVNVVAYGRDKKTGELYARMCTSNSAILMFISNLNSFRNAERNENILTAEGKANKEFKQEDPSGYVKHRLRVSKVRYPQRFEENQKKAEEYLSKP